MAEYDSGIITCEEEWGYFGQAFESYGAGLRYIYFEHGGRDTEFFAGNYGSQFDDFEILIDFNTLTSNSEVEKEIVTYDLYPNPSRGIINIDLSQDQGTKESTISIVNAQGQVMREEVLRNSNSIILDLHHLPSGAYWVHLKSGQATEVKKLILQ